MYPKGGNMLHTIRQIINDDEKWRAILRGLNADFWHQTVTTQQIEPYIAEKAGIDLSKVFDQYLRTTEIPLLTYKIDGEHAVVQVRESGRWIRDAGPGAGQWPAAGAHADGRAPEQAIRDARSPHS